MGARMYIYVYGFMMIYVQWPFHVPTILIRPVLEGYVRGYASKYGFIWYSASISGSENSHMLSSRTCKGGFTISLLGLG